MGGGKVVVVGGGGGGVGQIGGILEVTFPT